VTQDLPKEFLQLCRSISNKRARIVIDHIIENGYITTEELSTKYGYKHPPRAARDVRDHGIPLETFKITSNDGRSIAAYRFGDLTSIRSNKLSGRMIFSKDFKRRLVEKYGAKCTIYQEEFEERYLQIDHRIPYEIAGDAPSNDRNLDDYMLLCGSANRAKSWSCEHCKNWIEYKSEEICQTCYWAYPENYAHIAMRSIRRIDIIWSDREVEIYERLKSAAEKQEKDTQEYIKEVLTKSIGNI
jgi:hypothetical protein